MEHQNTDWRSVTELVVWERNYRKGALAAIERSIVRFGFNSALRIRGSSVVAGNHSLLALQRLHELGADPPKGIRVEGGVWLVPCIDLSHLDEEEAAAFAIADNRIHDLGSDDHGALAALLVELSATGLPADAGYDDHSLELLLAELETPKFEPDPDNQGRMDTSPAKTLRCPRCGHEWSQS